MKIAMWSGPRNLSTAMMYAFASRSDCAVWDEPFYAPYLRKTGLDHPMREAILAAHDTDPKSVAKVCIDPKPREKPHFYMKHMPHHMLPGFPIDWAKDCQNLHLLRHPARVIASYGQKRSDMTLEDLGFPQQARVYDEVGGHIFDSHDIRKSPKAALTQMCQVIGINFENQMLSWQPGGRTEDGVWASHWYGAVHQSTGFAGPEGPLPHLSREQQRLCDQAMPFYEHLKRACQKVNAD